MNRVVIERAPNMSTHMYRVGDYVYFETSSAAPYQIRRIEELNKTPSGNVEAKVMCFYRRRDLPNHLIQLADKHQMSTSDDPSVTMKLKKAWLRTPVGDEQLAQPIVDPLIAPIDEERTSPNGSIGSNSDKGEILNTKQRHQVKHRELFLSRQVETLPATHIRGKCSVTLLNETESLTSYLNKEDTFFYCLVFDPNQRTLLADKGEIRVGNRYQTEITPLLKENESDGRDIENLETLVWTPNHSLSDRKIDQFLVVSRSVGTFARALDCSSSVKQPSLHMSAAAASRDITLFHAMDTLHKHNYSVEEAMCALVPSSGPVLCRDEMEEWSASEANLFEEALDKYGKDFNDIRQDFLPWKTLKNIVEYYYMWKTTDRYVQQKRVKAVEAESKLKQVYIPNYTKNAPPAVNAPKGMYNGNSNLNGGGDPICLSSSGKPCESCSTMQSPQWYTWGPANLNYRLCHNCWHYWKKYGGLKTASRLIEGDAEILKKKAAGEVEDEKLNEMSNRQQHRCVSCGKDFKLKIHLARHYAQAHGIAIRSGSPRPIMKTRTAFYLHTTSATRLARRLCKHIIKPRKASRQPCYAINIQAVKQEFSTHMTGKVQTDMQHMLLLKKKDRGSVTRIANRLGNPGPGPNEWLVLTLKENLPKPEKIAFPKPPTAADGSLVYERVPNKLDVEKENTVNAPTAKKRTYDETNGTEGSPITCPPTKRPNKDPMPSHRPSPEQYAAMMAAAAAAGQPLPRHHLNGKPKIAQMARSGSGRKQVISWMDAPDDVYFRATESSRKARKALSLAELRRAARKPWRNLPVAIPPIVSAPSDLQVVILD